MRWLGIVTLVLVAGCKRDAPTSDEPSPHDGGPLARVPVKLPWKGGLPMLTNIAPPPPNYAEATRLYRTATTSLAHGDLEGAADAMIRTTEKLQLPEGHPHLETFEAARCIIYANAAATWTAKGLTDVAQKRLEELRLKDPACANSIEYIQRL